MRGAARITQASTTRAAISAAGEEATIVGVTSVMRPDDYLIGTYRTHGHGIAGGTDPKNVMAELFGRVDGTSRGRGGFCRGDRPAEARENYYMER